MKILEATTNDTNEVLNIIRQAFGNEKEPQLVSDMLSDPSAEPKLSLLASINEQCVGHILFTAVRLIGAQTSLKASILAPLAIRPDFQGQGIGGALVKEGLRLLKGDGVDLVFVLGHIDYYPRFGFQTAGRLGFEAPFLQDLRQGRFVERQTECLVG